MTKVSKGFTVLLAVIVLVAIILLVSCKTPSTPKTGNVSENNQPGSTLEQNETPKPRTYPPKPEQKTHVRLTEAEIKKIRPNEDGKIMIVMFHNFVETFKPSKGNNGEYTTTFDAFSKLLGTLYDNGYRLIGLEDLLDNNIAVAAGCIPMVFTFDDATDGQFNLIEKDGRLEANPRSAVGIMEEFNKTHPDFGMKGTFYVNLGLEVFKGKGTVAQRLRYLIDKGFDIGNHTLHHVHLNDVKNADVIQKEIGGNQKAMYELIPGYKLETFSLPFGQASKELERYVINGEYNGVRYENRAVLAVGWDPNVSPVSREFNPLYLHRVRASGIRPVQADLEWWLKNLPRSGQYISDGNPDTVTVPKERQSDVDMSRLKGKELIVY